MKLGRSKRFEQYTGDRTPSTCRMVLGVRVRKGAWVCSGENRVGYTNKQEQFAPT